ncbi:MAG: hypothetical protein K1W41_26550 [Lachnospiraceae bacterium]
MARKSRKQAVIQAPETVDTSLKVYRTALYARLSADENNRDAGTTTESREQFLTALPLTAWSRT